MYLNVLNLYETKGYSAKSKGSSSKRGAEYAGECPACGGTDRFLIWPEQNNGQGSYHCRKCEIFGDAIEFLREFEGMSFFEAQKAVTGKTEYKPTTQTYIKKQEVKNIIEVKEASEVVSDLWVTKASAFQTYCAAQLENFPQVIASLASRGINCEDAKRYGIGYCPGENGKSSMMRHRKAWGLENRPASRDKKEGTVLWLPRGIVVPVLENTQTKRLRIRRDDKDRETYNSKMKYYVVPGSDMTPLFLPSTKGVLPANYAVMVVEGELDAYMLHSKIGDFCAVLSIMTAKISSIPKHIMSILKASAFIFVATDIGDKSQAGYEGWLKWQETFKNAKRFPCIGAKDPGEMVEKNLDVRLWAMSALPNVYIKQILDKEKETQEAPTLPQEVQKPQEASLISSHPLSSVFRNCNEFSHKEKTKNETSEKELAAHKRFIKQFFSLEGEYIGNFDFIEILECYGITVVPTIDDFFLKGYEKWSGKDWVKLLFFTRKYSEQIKNQLRELKLINCENKERSLA